MVTFLETARLILKALNGKGLNKEEIVELLSIDRKEQMEMLFEAAREAREGMFKNKAFIYGFVYFSTHCRNECRFCYYRRSNKHPRYRKTPGEIEEACERLIRSGVNLVDLTMGEDEYFHGENFASVLEMVRGIKSRTNIPVMVSPGVVGNDALDALADAGADWYALYQETHNKALYKRLRTGQSYEERMRAKLYAKSAGMMIEEGILVGVGETLGDIADSLNFMNEIGARQMRVMSFNPHPGTPMAHVPTPERTLELKVIALMRLLSPGVLIPASLDVDGFDGLAPRMNAGANVVTSIIPPKAGLTGVAQTGGALEENGRTVAEAAGILRTLGLVPATTREYGEFLYGLKEDLCLSVL